MLKMKLFAQILSCYSISPNYYNHGCITTPDSSLEQVPDLDAILLRF